MNWMGLASIVVFYLAILGVGLWASRKTGRKKGEEDEESDMEADIMLAGRNIGLWVGICTMTATWVGGGYINGTAEYTYSLGVVWCQAPFGYALSLLIGGLFFANKMRSEGYVTMLDPFCNRFGHRMGGLLFIPCLLGEVFWSAAILAALGATLSVILGWDKVSSVIVSACIAIGYTLTGGLTSVAYTDVIQLGCIFSGLCLSIPFALYHPAVTPISETFFGNASLNETGWAGANPGDYWGQYLDSGLLLVFGGIPWQVYFQRVLSAKSAVRAQLLSYVAAVGCIILAIPPIVIGAIAKSTDWNATNIEELGEDGNLKDPEMVLPLVLALLTPEPVAFVGLGAVSAAVMSSADSSVLGASSMFARNVYHLAIRPNASEREIRWVLKISIFLVGVLATVTGLTVKSIAYLWYLCADLVYVVLFPQLTCVVYVKWCNTYGAFSGYVVGLLLRILGGELSLGVHPIIFFPNFDYECYGDYLLKPDGAPNCQLFPFKTVSMLIAFATILSVSYATKYIFEKGILDRKWDVFKCVINISDGTNIVLQDAQGGELKAIDVARLGTCYGEPGLSSSPSPGTPERAYPTFHGKNTDVHKAVDKLTGAETLAAPPPTKTKMAPLKQEQREPPDSKPPIPLPRPRPSVDFGDPLNAPGRRQSLIRPPPTRQDAGGSGRSSSRSLHRQGSGETSDGPLPHQSSGESSEESLTRQGSEESYRPSLARQGSGASAGKSSRDSFVTQKNTARAPRRESGEMGDGLSRDFAEAETMSEQRNIGTRRRGSARSTASGREERNVEREQIDMK